MALGAHFCVDQLGLPFPQPMCSLVHMPSMADPQHALRSQGDLGVRSSFRDFLQGKGWHWKGHAKGSVSESEGQIPINSRAVHNTEKEQALRLFDASKAARKPGVGKGNGLPSKASGGKAQMMASWAESSRLHGARGSGSH